MPNKKVKYYQRILSSLLDLVIFVLLSFAFSNLIVQPVLNASFHMSEVNQTYNDKLVEYQLYEKDGYTYIEIELPVEQKQERVDLFNQDEVVKECLHKQKLVHWYLNYSISIICSFLICYILVPLCLKGQTFFMKIFKIAIVNDLGYQVSKTQIVYRNSCMIIYSVLPAMIFGGIYTTLLFWCIEFLAFICFVLFQKDMKGLHDYLALTKYAYCDKNTLIFSSNEEEKKYLLELEKEKGEKA